MSPATAASNGCVFNSKGQSPCLVSSWLFTPCSSPSNSFVSPLPHGYHYVTPLNSSDSATPCRCNTVLFSTMSACATCQGEGDYIIPWLTYSQNCANTYIEKYPENIPAGTAIPAWAYLDVRVNGTFDPAAAEALAAQNLPESSAAPALSTSPTTSGTTSGPSTAPGDTSDSSSKKSNAGAIAGGVVGALAGLALVGAAVFFPLRLRSSRSSAPSGGWARTVYSADPQSWEKSPVTSVSTHRFYNPNDPRTFPGQDPFVSRPLHASVAYSAGVASSNRDTVVTTQSPYRAVPEL
ncbi:hypothetical protein V8D89_005457 [Ganoderma adspersum]